MKCYDELTGCFEVDISIVLAHCDLFCPGLVHRELRIEINLIQVRHGRIEVVEVLRERDGVHGGLTILLRQVDHPGSECHLDLDKGLITIGQEVLGLPRVDSHHTQQKMAGSAERHLHLGLKDALDGLLDVGLEDVGFGQLLVPMGGQPNSGQRALLGQDEVGVEHPGATAA